MHMKQCKTITAWTERLLSAMLMLSIWNPDTWNFYPNKRRKQQIKMYYRAMGIVLHDRELNGEAR